MLAVNSSKLCQNYKLPAPNPVTNLAASIINLWLLDNLPITKYRRLPINISTKPTNVGNFVRLMRVLQIPNNGFAIACPKLYPAVI